ncbi:hypothetical protein O3P69_005575 [Scylla paramamosain]|uniref:Innexin n=1 Tax=Scylla paramamosain TaxID=85552 RepID=A0AAW0U9Z9_SCYPA
MNSSGHLSSSDILHGILYRILSVLHTSNGVPVCCDGCDAVVCVDQHSIDSLHIHGVWQSLATAASLQHCWLPPFTAPRQHTAHSTRQTLSSYLRAIPLVTPLRVLTQGGPTRVSRRLGANVPLFLRRGVVAPRASHGLTAPRVPPADHLLLPSDRQEGREGSITSPHLSHLCTASPLSPAPYLYRVNITKSPAPASLTSHHPDSLTPHNSPLSLSCPTPVDVAEVVSGVHEGECLTVPPSLPVCLTDTHFSLLTHPPREGARMPSIGAGSVDIRSIFSSILNVIKSRANQICSATCDGLVLRMHYRWTFCLLLGGFLTVWYSWYHRDVITCVSHFNAETQVRLDYINICLSYPYLEEEENGPRRYILFYRWISWSLLVLAGVFYIPRKISKSLDNARCKKLLEDLASNASRYDQVEEQLVERAARYLIFNLKTHNGLYWKYLGVNVLALGVDLFAMQYLDFILQGRFIGYGFNSYPFSRDPRTFTDYMSQTFPPFATCELTRVNQLTNKRTEKFGCHLTIMELYEKVFLVLWLWLILLTFLTCCYLVFLACMWLPCVRCYLLRTAKPAHGSDKVRNVIQKVAANCKIGDIYLLYRLKGTPQPRALLRAHDAPVRPQPEERAAPARAGAHAGGQGQDAAQQDAGHAEAPPRPAGPADAPRVPAAIPEQPRDDAAPPAGPAPRPTDAAAKEGH